MPHNQYGTQNYLILYAYVLLRGGEVLVRPRCGSPLTAVTYTRIKLGLLLAGYAHPDGGKHKILRLERMTQRIILLGAAYPNDRSTTSRKFRGASERLCDLHHSQICRPDTRIPVNGAPQSKVASHRLRRRVCITRPQCCFKRVRERGEAAHRGVNRLLPTLPPRLDVSVDLATLTRVAKIRYKERGEESCVEAGVDPAPLSLDVTLWRKKKNRKNTEERKVRSK